MSIIFLALMPETRSTCISTVYRSTQFWKMSLEDFVPPPKKTQQSLNAVLNRMKKPSFYQILPKEDGNENHATLIPFTVSVRGMEPMSLTA